MQPFVSIIIPNYNHTRYLDQRIQSVLGQTYQNFEVIILDEYILKVANYCIKDTIFTYEGFGYCPYI